MLGEASPSMISWVFILQGAMVGAIGTAGGTIGGLLVIKFRNQINLAIGRLTGTEIFPKELYHLNEIPAHIHPPDIVLIVATIRTISGG